MVDWRCSNRQSEYIKGKESQWIGYPEHRIKYYSPPTLKSKIVIEIWNCLYSHEREWIIFSEMNWVTGFSLLNAKSLLEASGFSLLNAKSLLEAYGIEWHTTIHPYFISLYGSKLISYLKKSS